MDPYRNSNQPSNFPPTNSVISVAPGSHRDRAQAPFSNVNPYMYVPQSARIPSARIADVRSEVTAVSPTSTLHPAQISHRRTQAPNFEPSPAEQVNSRRHRRSSAPFASTPLLEELTATDPRHLTMRNPIYQHKPRNLRSNLKHSFLRFLSCGYHEEP